MTEMGKTLLAIDVGGSTSRACLIDETGRCLGRGRNLGGNPASNTPEQAASAIISAVETAVAEAGLEQPDIAIALIALAGPQKHVALAKLETAFRAVGLTGPIVFVGDVQAMFSSVTATTEGYCVIAGTGAGAVRIRGGQVERVVDLAGWLAGDLGSGFWLGQQAARAAVADLEGRGERTALTAALLAAFNIPWSGERILGRPAPLRLLIDAIYAIRPIELARFAPLVFANRDDPVAARLIIEAEGYLATHFALAFDAMMPGPVVLGGGVIAHLTGVAPAIADIVRAAGHEPDIRMAADGSVGAAVLALRAVGISVDEAMVATIAASMAGRAPSAVAP
jgi:N-acetylglucosamine kinase-like BadF-type ATPase